MMSRTTLASALVFLTALTLAAQQPPGRDDQPPITFRVEVNYVEIDAIVTDAQ
jgi:hypothetical protein